MLPPNALLSATSTYATRLFNALFGVNYNLFFCICKDPFFLFFMSFITNFFTVLFANPELNFSFLNFYISYFQFLY